MFWKCAYCDKDFYDDDEYFLHRELCVKKEQPNMNFENTPVQEAINKNEILSEVQSLLESQTEKGLKNYPRTVNEEDYNLNEWIDHAREELIDTLVYLTVIKQKIKKVIG